jgi:hypothetical protein
MNTHNSRGRGVSRFRLAATLLALAALPWFTGCVVVAAGAVGAGAVAYVRGELASSLEHELDAVYRATQSVLARQEFARIDERKSGLDVQLVYRTALDKRVEIKLEKITDRLTKVKIRVGLVGDQDLSMMLLEKIRAELD